MYKIHLKKVSQVSFIETVAYMNEKHKNHVSIRNYVALTCMGHVHLTNINYVV